MSTEPRIHHSATTSERADASAPDPRTATPDTAEPGTVDATPDTRVTAGPDVAAGASGSEVAHDVSPTDRPSPPSAGDTATGGDPRLVPVDEVDQLRTRWHELQAHFVDDPRESVTRADELVGETIERLTALFAERRRTLAAGWSGAAETEQLRTALRDYRSLFERLVS
ncbi:hypothetical protein [Nocardia shimofusensis]|uniref:hypothetical protein n=1 Tax=Nocardia shimofusensis TaxID=228596 RepID=UPI00082F654E|nr:hypothetical protein [Nocardia shimofusensis]